MKRKAREFLKEFGLSQVTLEDLRRVLASQGYTIVEFNHIFNEECVAQLIEALRLDEMVEKVKGFTYADSQRRIVFLHEDLSEKEKLLVLAHEEGHIYCNHFSVAPIIGRDVVEEHEANEFTHYLLNADTGRKFQNVFSRHKQTIAVVAAAAVALTLLVALFAGNQQRQSSRTVYYITATGNKYHKRDCMYIKGKDNVITVTMSELRDGGYEPCGVCLPQGNEGG